MTYLAFMVDAGEGFGEELEREVTDVLADVLLPKVINREVIERCIRRALRNGSWFKLSKLQRALLKAASRVVKVVKSPVLAEALKRVLLEIELNTLKGKALYYGLLTALSIGEPLNKLLNRLTYVMMLGINYLNNPPLYRVID